MATQFPEPIVVQFIDPIAIAINSSIDRLVILLNQRRGHLLATLREKREEIRADLKAGQQMEAELVQTRTLIEGQMKHNLLHSMQGRMMAEMETKLAELHLNAPPLQELRFSCNTQDIEERIARLGEITQQEIPHIPPIQEVPNYAAFQQPKVAVGKQGSAPGMFDKPRGVAIEPQSGHVYVTDMNNSRIQIFSQTGDHLNQFGASSLKYPCGILINQDNIYVTDRGHHAIFLFKLPDLTMIQRVGKEGSGSEEFNYPRQLAISPNQLLYVPDEQNNRLQILTTNLIFEGSLQHQTMTRPADVKFLNDEMFVLSWKDNPCIHVFSLSERSPAPFLHAKIKDHKFKEHVSSV